MFRNESFLKLERVEALPFANGVIFLRYRVRQ